MQLTRRFLCALACFAPALSATAQDMPMHGSENYILEAPSIVGGGGAMSSTIQSALVSVGGPTSPYNCISQSYMLWGGAGLFAAESSNQPAVFGVAGGQGDKDGGQPVTLFGRNLAAPGAGLTTADFGGLPVTGLTVVSNTVVQGTAAQGINQYLNPLGQVDVSLQNQNGSSTRPDAFAYTPAIIVDSIPAVGGQYGLSLHAPPGSILSMSYGITIPGLAIPLFNLDGAIEIILQITPIIPLTVCPPSGHFQLTATIPPAPSLAGLMLPLQAIAFNDLVTLTGSFSNMKLLPIQ